MKKRQYEISFLFLLLLAFSLTGCEEPESEAETYSGDFFAMDTYIRYQLLTEDKALAEAGMDKVEETFLEIDRLTNRFQESELSAVNKNAGLASVKVSKELFEIVETALKWSDKTDGAFNILIGSVMDMWGFGSEKPTVPTEEELAEALSKTDYHKIMLDAEQSTLFLPEKGMVMDLGGVAKGYATDKAVEALKELGIENAIINAGGNIYALGSKDGKMPWKVGVQDPRDSQGIAALLEVRDAALVSSGGYQRYFEVDGIRYHHILDPATGCPARASAGTTVIMKSAVVADILSTALFVKGPVEGIALAEELNQVAAVMILTENGEMYGTKDLSDFLIE